MREPKKNIVCTKPPFSWLAFFPSRHVEWQYTYEKRQVVGESDITFKRGRNKVPGSVLVDVDCHDREDLRLTQPS
jgi:hypothetical protein